LTKEFIKHLFPRVVLKDNLKISYTLCLGGLSFVALFVLTVTGILLMFYYQPEKSAAYNSILFIEENIFLGKYMRDLHKFATHAYLILVFGHTLRVILTGAYKFRTYNWMIGMILLFLSIFEAYTGYLLPMDQLALWATQTGMELFRSVLFGDVIRDILVPDNVGESMTLLRFYVLHIVVIPAITFVLIMLHFYRIRKDRGVLPYL